MDYKNIGNQIMTLDSNIRFVTVIDINNDSLLFSEHAPGVTNLLTKEESDQSLQFTLSAWKIRDTLKNRLEKESLYLQKMKRLNVSVCI